MLTTRELENPCDSVAHAVLCRSTYIGMPTAKAMEDPSRSIETPRTRGVVAQQDVSHQPSPHATGPSARFAGTNTAEHAAVATAANKATASPHPRTPSFVSA